MLLVKFKKEDSARYTSHVDMQRTLNRMIRRAGFTPEYSGGFHPHVLMKLSPPIPLGVESEAEYFTLEIKNVSAKEFQDGLNKVAQAGISVTMATELEKSPNVAGNTVAAEYRILGEAPWEKIAMEKANFSVWKKDRNGNLTKESAGDKIFEIVSEPNGARVKLAHGNVNLRIDRFIEAVNENYGTRLSLSSVKKTALYFANGCFDSYF